MIKFFIDTHVAIWVASGEFGLLSENAKSKLFDKSSKIIISPISLLEIEFLREKNKFNYEVGDVIRKVEELVELEISKSSTLELTEKALDLKWTRDPFDRLIVADAMAASSTLITKDRMILKNYQKAIW